MVQEGWSGIKNGKLLALAAARFDAFITVDKNLPYQQNSSRLPLVPALEEALVKLKPGDVRLVRLDA